MFFLNLTKVGNFENSIIPYLQTRNAYHVHKLYINFGFFTEFTNNTATPCKPCVVTIEITGKGLQYFLVIHS